MKRIVILCDGTWNRSDSATPTNVVQLAQALAPRDADGHSQVPIYVQGVGTGQGVSVLSRWSDRFLGGALGWGLLENIAEAYRHLVFLWEPGDEIHIFGFSRGAYTARSLTGLIRSTGIPSRAALARVPEAVKRYRTLDDDRTHPDHADSHAFRAGLSPQVVTSQREAEWRAAQGLPKVPRLRIAYLGVWDSVAALGLPAHLPVIGPAMARRYRFHDSALSSMVRSARHAVALDERRRSFAAVRWGNVDVLNDGADPPRDGTPDYQELFFAGDHGSVGGGGDIRDLSSIALDWIIEGAARSGLAFDETARAAIRAERNPAGPLHNRSVPSASLSDRITRLRPADREGPKSVAELHPSALERWMMPERKAAGAAFRTYRPGSLSGIEAELVAMLDRQEDDPSGVA